MFFSKNILYIYHVGVRFDIEAHESTWMCLFLIVCIESSVKTLQVRCMLKYRTYKECISKIISSGTTLKPNFFSINIVHVSVNSHRLDCKTFNSEPFSTFSIEKEPVWKVICKSYRFPRFLSAALLSLCTLISRQLLWLTRVLFLSTVPLHHFVPDVGSAPVWKWQFVSFCHHYCDSQSLRSTFRLKKKGGGAALYPCLLLNAEIL